MHVSTLICTEGFQLNDLLSPGKITAFFRMFFFPRNYELQSLKKVITIFSLLYLSVNKYISELLLLHIWFANIYLPILQIVCLTTYYY
jgi:hypothetical protein